MSILVIDPDDKNMVHYSRDSEPLNKFVGLAWHDTTTGYLKVWDGVAWRIQTDLALGGNVGIFAGGLASSNINVIEYIMFSTPYNAFDFGDLTEVKSDLAATSNGIFDRGVTGGGNGPSNVLEYITISSTGNSSDFGDLTTPCNSLAATSNGTNGLGVFAGGVNPAVNPVNIIDYIAIASAGDASDFGDISTARYGLAATSNGTDETGVFIGGTTGSATNVIDYVTISSAGDAVDFGDLLSTTYYLAATSNGTDDRGVIGGGTTGLSGPSYVLVNTINYITISTPGNSVDFGDLTISRMWLAATSNGSSDLGIFGGGYTTSSVNTIDYITITSVGNASDFGDLTLARYSLAATSDGLA